MKKRMTITIDYDDDEISSNALDDMVSKAFDKEVIEHVTNYDSCHDNVKDDD